MYSYIKVAVYVTPEYSGEKFALKLGQILSVHPQVTHPRPSNNTTILKFTVFEWGFVCVCTRKFVRNAELKQQHENCLLFPDGVSGNLQVKFSPVRSHLSSPALRPLFLLEFFRINRAKTNPCFILGKPFMTT